MPLAPATETSSVVLCYRILLELRLGHRWTFRAALALICVALIGQPAGACSSAKNKFRPGPPNYAPAATQTRAVALAVASPIIFVCLMCFQFQFQISVKKVNSRFDWTSWQIFLKGTWSLQNYKGKFWYIPLINCCLFVIPLPCMDLLVNGHSNNFNLYTQKFHNSSKFILFRTRIVVLSKRMV
jgi:hypothetical protein